MPIYETCPYCEELHDLLAFEPSFRMPDAYLAVPPAQREFRTMATKDACAIRDMDDSNRRYFLRVLAPFYVEGLPDPVSWGVWVEVKERDFQRVQELWSAPEQAEEPPFFGTMANKLPAYENTLEITGVVTLTDPTHIPAFNATAPEDHRFVIEQRTGVSTQRVAEWLAPIHHPEALVSKPRSTPQS